MANNLTDSEERRLLDASLDGTYLCLFTASPGEAGSLTNEVTGGSYARVAATFNAASTDGSNATTKTLSGDLSFTAASADWGTITHFGFASASSAGTLRWYAPLDVAKTVLSGDTYKQVAASTVASLN